MSSQENVLLYSYHYKELCLEMLPSLLSLWEKNNPKEFYGKSWLIVKKQTLDSLSCGMNHPIQSGGGYCFLYQFNLKLKQVKCTEDF